jgi:hypothetical protein
MVSVTVPEGFVTLSVSVSPALKVTGKLSVPSVKLPSGLIVPVAIVTMLRESVTERAAGVTGQLKVYPVILVQLPVAPESIELQRGEPVSEQVSIPDRPDTVTEREEIF